MAFNGILDSELDPDSPLTSSLGYRWRDNLIASLDGSVDAPVISTSWHYYNQLLVGDGNDGVIYDFAVDGPLLTLVTPPMVDGYEYGFYFSGIVNPLSLPSSADLNVEFFADAAGVYGNSRVVLVASTVANSLFMRVLNPRVLSTSMKVDDLANLTFSPADTVSLMRLSTIVAVTGGKIHFMRRREYISA